MDPDPKVTNGEMPIDKNTQLINIESNPDKENNKSIESPILAKNFSLVSNGNVVEVSEGLKKVLMDVLNGREISKKEIIEWMMKEVQYQNFPILDENGMQKFEFLGKGTYGKVFRATYNGLEVALKELEIEKVFKDILKFLQEINMSIMCYHPFVPKFHGVYFNDYVCLVFDLVKGKSLKEVAEVRYKDQYKLKYNALIKLVKIINDLHTKLKIIHRDLKPDNIIVSDDDEVFLIDFGTSKVVSGFATNTYDAKGTTIYMAPENYKLREPEEGEKDLDDERPITLTVAFDVWSLGCIISEICSGIQPWKNHQRKNLNETIIMKFLSESKDFPIPVDLPDNLKELLAKCFMQETSERIKTADLLQKLTEIRDCL